MPEAAIHPRTNPYYLPRIDSIPYLIQEKLSGSAVRLYQVLKGIHDQSYSPETDTTNCMPSYKKLAELVHVSIRTIHTGIHQLKKQGLIDHIHRWNAETGHYKTNLYFVPRIIYQVIKTAWESVKKGVHRVKRTASIVSETINTIRKTPQLNGLGGGLLSGITKTLGEHEVEARKMWDLLIKEWDARQVGR